MRRFVAYRVDPPPFGNPADQVQFEGVQFTDGSVVTRWRTDVHSMYVYDSFDDFWKIGGHGTRLFWVDYDVIDDAYRKAEHNYGPDDGETPTLVAGYE